MNDNHYENAPGTKNCPHCGASVHENASFCGNCGRSLQTVHPNPPYEAPIQPQADVMGVLDYIVMMILFSLPIIGLILMLYWGFSNTSGINRKNFARSYLVIYLVQFVLSLVLMLLFGTVFAGVMEMAYGVMQW